MFRIAFCSLVLTACALGAEPAAPALQTVAELDLARYEGRWYEIARKPNRFQEACARDVLVQYTRRVDGRLDVFNQCSEQDGDVRSVNGIARIPAPEQAPGRLEVRFAPAFLSFLPMVWADYWVLELDPSYRWAVVGGPGLRYLWVLSRTPSLPRGTLDGILTRVREQGYDTSDLVVTLHGDALGE